MRKTLSLIILILSALYCYASDLSAQVSDPIVIPLNPPIDTTDLKPDRSLFLEEIPECLHDPISSTIYIEAQCGQGLFEVVVVNQTTMLVHRDLVDSNTTTSIPISGSPGYYTITIYTEDDRVFWGEFWISL